MNALLLITAMLAAEPDLAAYKKACADRAKDQITGLVANLEGAKGAERQKIRDQIAKLKSKPPLIGITSLEKPGAIGTITRQLIVKDTAGPSAKVALIVGVYNTDAIPDGLRLPLGSANRIAQMREKIGEKEGPTMIIDDVDSTQWKVGDTITLPPDQIFVVESPMVVRAIQPTAAVKAMRERMAAAKNK